MPWIYRQRSGALIEPNGTVIAHGYSGFGEGKNNPEMQYVKSVGPVPVGSYKIGPPYNSPKVGPYALILDSLPGTDTRGRGDFRIHGDNATNTASHGCLIFPRNIREAIWKSKDRTLTVVE